MKKFIIKNCPAIYFRELDKKPMCNDLKQGSYTCYECSDCIPKQLYEKMKDCNCELINYIEIEVLNATISN